MSKLKLEDTVMDIAMKMSEGNPGALRVVMELLLSGPIIDPDAGSLAPVAAIMNLDTLGIYGSHIWLLYEDVCGESMLNLYAVSRGWQLGYLKAEEIRGAIDDAEKGTAGYPALDVTGTLAKVQERLPNFGKNGDSK